MEDEFYNLESKEDMLLLSLQRTVKYDGGTPSRFLDSLAEAIRVEFWKKREDKSFKNFIIDNVGVTWEDLKHIYKLKHKKEQLDDKKDEMAAMRVVVEQLIDLEDSEPGGKGGNNNPSGHNQYTDKVVNDDNVNIDQSQSPYGNSKQSGLRRLNKELKKSTGQQFEHISEMQQMVIEGKKSVNSALIELGIRKKMISIPVGDVEKCAKIIEKYFTKDEIKEIKAKL